MFRFDFSSTSIVVSFSIPPGSLSLVKYPVECVSTRGTPKEVEVRGGKAPYADNALKVMPIVPSPVTFYDRERP
jgi:hypothetical protein